MYDRSTIYPVILRRIAEGESLRTICATDGLPHIDTVMTWVDGDPAFSVQYARARDARADYHFEKTVEIASQRPDMVDASEGGDTNHKAGGSRIDTGFVAWQKLQVDTHKWVASKLAPKKYADKVDVNVGGQPGNPLQSKVVVEYIGAAPGGVPLPKSTDS